MLPSPWRRPPCRHAAKPGSRRSPTSRPARCADRAATVALLACCLLAGAVRAQAPATPSDEDKVEALLARYGLLELQTLHLERELARPGTDGKQAALARRLAGLYVDRLLAAQKPDRVEDLTRRVNELVRKYPQALTPSLRVLLLQGDYQRAEALARRWADVLSQDAEGKKARGEARKLFEDVVPQLDRTQEELQRAAEEAAERLERLRDERLRKAGEPEVRQLRNVANRASYFSGWGNYYLGLLGDAAEAPGRFRAARQRFNPLFGIDKPEPDAKAEELGLGEPALARAALGIALASVAAGDEEAARAWFRVLRDKGTSADARDELGYWEVLAYLNAGQPARAAAVARRVFSQDAAFSDAPTPARISLCVLLVRAGHPREGPAQPELGRLGLGGLLRIRRFDLARALVERHGIKPEGAQGFAVLWMQGQNLLDRAEKTRAADDYRVAAELLGKALADEGARQEPLLAGLCHYALGWCHYRLGDPARAADELAAAVPALRIGRDDTAPKAAWMLAHCRLALAAKDARHTAAAAEALLAFQRDFPNDPNAPRASLLLLRLKREPIRLESFDPTGPVYLDACQYAVQQKQRHWQQAQGGARATAAAQLRALAEKVLGLPRAAERPELLLECRLALVQLALKASPADVALAERHLKEAEPLAAPLPPTHPLAGDFHYWKLERAQVARDPAGEQEQARWLARHARGTPREEKALVVLARLVEADLARAPGDRQQQVREEALEVYRQLVRLLGDAPEKLKANKNAQIACSRLAGHALDAGRYDEAARLADRLLEAFPRDRNYLRKGGLASFHAGRFPRALECWGRLCKGLKAGTPEWFEAKYHHAATLARLDPKAARVELEQLRLLYPELGPPPWPGEFQKLDKVLPR